MPCPGCSHPSGPVIIRAEWLTGAKPLRCPKCARAYSYREWLEPLLGPTATATILQVMAPSQETPREYAVTLEIQRDDTGRIVRVRATDIRKTSHE